jgi:hypothetical protein
MYPAENVDPKLVAVLMKVFLLVMLTETNIWPEVVIEQAPALPTKASLP